VGRRLDVAFVEGSVTDEHAAERLKKIRAARTLVALGSCDDRRVNGMKNAFDLIEVGRSSTARTGACSRRRRRGRCTRWSGRVHDPRLPDLHPEFSPLGASSGIPYTVPDQAVCTECKRNENVCLYDRG
jgi:hypothetical protein